MSKTLAIFFAIAAIILGLLLAVFALRFEMSRTETTFLMKLTRLEHATIAEYEAEFGKAPFVSQSIENMPWDQAGPQKEKLKPGQTIYFFQAHTIPVKYLAVVSNADGSVAWRTWVQM